jgi:predicted SprT family Zn-dependent metalloprotease
VNHELASKILLKYIPPPSVNYVIQLLDSYQIHLKIKNARQTKLGDFRPRLNPKSKHTITVNHDLNAYGFLITLIHEIAHAANWDKFGRKVKPHGAEWKQFFQELMAPIKTELVFPPDLLKAIDRYMANPAASSCSDPNLQKHIHAHDSISKLRLHELPHLATFKLNNGKIFEKGPLRRTRFLCKEMTSNKLYLVSALAEVIEN